MDEFSGAYSKAKWKANVHRGNSETDRGIQRTTQVIRFPVSEIAERNRLIDKNGGKTSGSQATMGGKLREARDRYWAIVL